MSVSNFEYKFFKIYFIWYKFKLTNLFLKKRKRKRR